MDADLFLNQVSPTGLDKIVYEACGEEPDFENRTYTLLRIVKKGFLTKEQCAEWVRSHYTENGNGDPI